MLISDDNKKSRRIIVVLSPDNVTRMQQGDPVTIDASLGGDPRLLIAIDKKADTLHKEFPNTDELEKHLMRGYVFDPGTDGPKNATPELVITIPDGPVRTINTERHSFEDFINNIVAPYTRAWTDYKLDQVIIRPGDIQKDEARFTLIVSARRRT